MLGIILAYSQLCHCGSDGFFTGKSFISGNRPMDIFQCHDYGHLYHVKAFGGHRQKQEEEDCADENNDNDFGPYQ